MTQNINSNDASAVVARETGEIQLSGRWNHVVNALLIAWSTFQVYLSSGLGPRLEQLVGFGIINDIYARAIHLFFGAVLCFLIYPARGQTATRDRIPPLDLFIASVVGLACIWQAVFFSDIIGTTGQTRPLTVPGLGPIEFEFLLGWCAILIILEAARRIVGLALTLIGSFFIVYTLFNQYLPEPFGLSAVSATRYVTTQWFGQEGIFGIPLGVSTNTIFLFVLFGALLDKGGAGKWFIDMAFASVGHLRGGPAKSAVLASGFTGMISGSSIANTVTTGTFTIPIMKQNGYPAEKAGAIEVASSVNGQIMPPIMGAAAFVMAEVLGMTYFEIIKHAFIPAVISYIALFYIVHLEACKLGLKTIPVKDAVITVLARGWQYLIPIAVLIIMLTVFRFSPDRSALICVITLIAVFAVEAFLETRGQPNRFSDALSLAGRVVAEGFKAGARNMIAVSIAVAAAGLVMGSIGASGLSNALQEVLTAIAGDSIIPILIATAVLSIILGMGLPTTANYLIVSTLMVGIVSTLGRQSGFDFPLVAIHLFCFYFGLMADVTPPVGLASYAAASISRADPIKTGFQAFWYSSRTAILPFVFLFNVELLLINVETIAEGILIFTMSLLAILAFTAASQGWMRTRLTWPEIGLLLLVCLNLFRPGLLQNYVEPPATRVIPIEQLNAGISEPSVVVRVINLLNEELTIQINAPENQDISAESLGIAVSPSFLHDGALQIQLREFNGPGAKLGLQNGMAILAIEAADERLSKYWYYIPGLIVLFGVWTIQGRRSRHPNPSDMQPS